MLSLHKALEIATSSLAESKAKGFAPMGIAVLDSGANVLVLLRDENSSLGRADIAMAKAAGCLAMGFGGRELARRAQSMPQFYVALNAIFPKGLVPLAGGVLLRNASGEVIGAVGVSGDTSDNDEACALAGIAAAGFVADTGAAQAPAK